MVSLKQSVVRKACAFLLLFGGIVTPSFAVDSSYYSSLDGKSGGGLFTATHTVAKTGYSSLSYAGLWTAYQTTDLNSSGEIWDMYGGCTFTYSSNQCGTYSNECDCYNREHSIPKSWFGGSTSNNTPGTDIFHVFPTDGKVNGMRSNYAFGEVNSATYSYNGSKLGTAKSISITNVICGSSVTATCSSTPVFEPIDEYKGDFARGYFGTLLRWEGDYAAFTTGDGASIFSGTYTTAGYYGLTQYGVALLMKWHREDPVSQKEIDRNNGIQTTQGNRNPFIDYPCLAEYLWGNKAGEVFNLSDVVGSFEPSFVPGTSDGCACTPASKYTITFQNYNGSVLQSSAFLTGITPTYSDTTPTRPATAQYTYTFKGWSPAIESVSAAATYTADYDSVVNNYTISVKGEHCSSTIDSIIPYGDTVRLNAIPESDYVFSQWADGNTDNPRDVVVTSDSIFVAQFTKILAYTIIFQNYDGSVLQSSAFSTGITPTYLDTTPTRPATAQYTYTFKGWSPAIESVSAAATYTADYDSVVNNYTISVKGEHCSSSIDSIIPYGDIVRLIVVPDSDFVFSQWTDGNTDNPRIVLVTSDSTFVAQFVTAEPTYTVSVKSDDCIDSVIYSVHAGDSIVLSAVPDSGYVFSQWLDGNTDNPRIVVITSDSSFVAVFAEQYTIKFQNYDGSICQQSNINSGDLPIYIGATPIRPNDATYTYTFIGWSPAIVVASANATYTAMYAATPKTIDGGEVAIDGPHEMGKADTIIAIPDSCSEFVEWQDGNTDNPRVFVVMGNETFVPTFAKLQYTITFQNYDGTVLQKSLIDCGDNPTYEGATPTKPATAQYTYTFKDWTPTIVEASADATYQAVFDSVSVPYVITFENYDGTILKRDTLYYGDTVVYSGIPTKPAIAQYTYTFKGWTPAIVAVSGAATYTAMYDSVPRAYIISFVNLDATVLQRDTLSYGDTPVYKGSTPSYYSAVLTYFFVGWAPVVEPVSATTTYKATYVTVPKTIQGADSVVVVGPHILGQYDTITAFPAQCYQFDQWQDGNTNNPRAFLYEENNPLFVPSFSKLQYTITFQNYDGTILKRDTLYCGDTAVYFGIPTKPATAQYTYTFKGWTPTIVEASANATYQAVFDSVSVPYVITFVDYDGTILKQETLYYGDMPSAPTEPTRASDERYYYIFKEWNPSIVPVNGSATYTATYATTNVEYTVTVVTDHSKSYGEGQYTYGSLASIFLVVDSGYTFEGWDDGFFNNPRTIQVTSDTTLKAIIVKQCGDLANLEVVALYDWLLMLNLQKLAYQGYVFDERNICWYRVVGEPDSTDRNASHDDVLVSRGAYLTIDKNFQGTGDYYAVLDAINDSHNNDLCVGLMRSEVVRYAGTKNTAQLCLLPSALRPTEQLRVVGLLPEEKATIRLFDAAGRLMGTYISIDTDTYWMDAPASPGVYNLQVQSESILQTLRYVVKP